MSNAILCLRDTQYNELSVLMAVVLDAGYDLARSFVLIGIFVCLPRVTSVVKMVLWIYSSAKRDYAIKRTQLKM